MTLDDVAMAQSILEHLPWPKGVQHTFIPRMEGDNPGCRYFLEIQVGVSPCRILYFVREPITWPMAEQIHGDVLRYARSVFFKSRDTDTDNEVLALPDWQTQAVARLSGLPVSKGVFLLACAVVKRSEMESITTPRVRHFLKTSAILLWANGEKSLEVEVIDSETFTIRPWSPKFLKASRLIVHRWRDRNRESGVELLRFWLDWLYPAAVDTEAKEMFDLCHVKGAA